MWENGFFSIALWFKRPEWCSDFPARSAENLCNDRDSLIYIRHRQTSSARVYAVAFLLRLQPHGT